MTDEQHKPPGHGDGALTNEQVAALTEYVKAVMYPAGKENAGAIYTDKSGRKYKIGPDGNHVRAED